MLIAKITQVSSGNQQAMLELIEQFDPLLHKYAAKLNYTDAYFDLRLMFVEMLNDLGKNKLQNIDSKLLIGYIKKAVEHAYYKLLYKKHRFDKDMPFSEISNEQLYMIQTKLSFEDTHDEMFFAELKSVLTKNEYAVIEKIFIKGESVVEIATQYGVSRQSINQTKNRALRKLRQWLSIDDKKL